MKISYARRLFSWIVLILSTINFSQVCASTPSGGSKRGDFNVSEYYSLPYRPYNSSRRFRRQSSSRASRPVNSNAANVVSCGSCCFENPVSLSESEFLNTAYRADLLEDNFYGKVLSVNGVPIASSSDVSDAAILETALTLVKMSYKNPHLLTLLRQETVHFAVLGRNEVLTDIPSYSLLGSGWNFARGVGATRWIPTSSCAEEDL